MSWETMIRVEDIRQLLANWNEQQPLKGTRREKDYHPVVKLFGPGAQTWLLTECDEDGLAFGLADMGFGEPELGYISLDEVAAVKLPYGLGVEQDRSFRASKPLSEYASEARKLRYIKA